MVKTSMGSDEKCRTEAQPGDANATRRALQTLYSCSSHEGFGVINEDFEFFAVNELRSLLFLKLLNSLINVIN